jgi:hypothetical protein
MFQGMMMERFNALVFKKNYSILNTSAFNISGWHPLEHAQQRHSIV